MAIKIERAIFYLFIFCIPFQTRAILKIWGGGFNEWNAAFLYGTDVLLLTLFIFWLIRKNRPETQEVTADKSAIHLLENSRGDSSRAKAPIEKLLLTARSRGSRVGRMADLSLLLFLAISTFSITQADNKILSFYNLLKLLEFVGLYYYIRTSLGKVISINGSFFVIIFSGFLQGFMAVGQSLLQQSLGLKWLGESVLRTNFAGVAVVPTLAGKFLRAYGTFPHPNVLAAWLFLATFAFYFWYLYTVRSRFVWTVFVVYPVLLWGLFSTFSRVAIGLLAVGVVVRLLAVLIKEKNYNLNTIFKRRLLLLSASTCVAVFLFSFFYWPQVQSRIFVSGQEQAVSQRILYTKLAGEMILNKPWLGVGLGQFVNAMSVSFKNSPKYLYQPVHNIYLLVANEVGILGLAVFILWLIALVYQYKRNTGFSKLYHLSF
ncbi:MAG: O-antigen ligase family protein, partial [bacterium]|nr:O-antigen ligase family protein [bacterium]